MAKVFEKLFKEEKWKSQIIKDDDEILREKYAKKNYIVLKSWKIPKTFNGENQTYGEKLIENMTQNMESPQQIALTESQSTLLAHLDPKNDKENTNTRNSGHLTRFL